MQSVHALAVKTSRAMRTCSEVARAVPVLPPVESGRFSRHREGEEACAISAVRMLRAPSISWLG